MKKKQTIKLCVVVAVFMLCLCMLVGCSDLTKENPSKENGTPSDIEETMKENETQIDVRWMYQIKRLKIGMTVSNTGNLTMCDEMVYFDGEVEKKDSTDSADRYKAIFSHNLSSAETAVVLFETLEKKLCNEENKLELTGMDVTAEGRLVTVFSEKKFGMPTSERIWLVMMDADGNLLWNAVIEDKRQAGIPLCVEDGIYVPIGNSILVYNTSGSLQNSYTIEQLPEEAGKVDWERGIRRLYRLKDGKEYLAYQEPAAFDAPDMILVEIDLRTGDMGEDIRRINLNNLLYVGEEGHYEFALKTSNGLFGRIEDEDGDVNSVPIILFQKSNLLGENLREITALDDQRFIAVYQNQDGNDICYLTPVDADEQAEKKVITLGMLKVGAMDFMQEVSLFNESQREYAIQVKDYSIYGNPFTQMSLDLSVGAGPDILYLDWYDSQSSFLTDLARQGFLEDLKPWFERDEEVETKDYLANIFEAFAVNGKWCQLVTSFSVYSYVGHEEVFSNAHWTLEDYDQLEKDYPGEKILSGTRENLLRDGIITRWEQFVDEEQGNCHFDSEEFVEFLEWINGFPTEDEYHFEVKKIRDGEIKATRTSFRDFSTFNVTLDKLFRKQSTFIGFPGAEGSGGIIESSGPVLAMSAQGKHKDMAWEFICQCLSDRNQSIVSDFPVKMSVLEEHIENAMNPPFGIYDSYRLDGEEISVESPTKTRIDQWVTYLKSLTHADTIDNEIYNIVVEEAGAFFAGQKTVQDVAKTIQGRVWIYLAEQQ